MVLPDIFSRRARLANQTDADVYHYDNIADNVRVQMLQIFASAVGEFSYDSHTISHRTYHGVVKIIREELGVFALANSSGNYQIELQSWLRSSNNVERVVDAIELMMRSIDALRNSRAASRLDPDAAIARMNARLMEAGVGYQYQSRQMIRVDSTAMHAEVVVPTIHLLSAPAYKSAESEYLKAHSAYRDGQYETCIIECAKAFESVLKIVATARGWAIKPSDPAKKLLDAAYASGFIEPALQAEFTALRSLLEGAVPTVRNKMSGHGAGVTPRNVPQHFAALQLHQTGAAILFLVQHHQANI